MSSEKKPPSVPWPVKFSYGVGHVFNDLCSSMWFSYLLIFLEKVLLFSPTTSGVLLLIGQLADGFSTPIVGIFSDMENKIPLCARYGRRKIWHLLGALCVLFSFPFIFSPCWSCSNSDEMVKILYYCCFIILFQFGWACVQISHLALIPDLTSKKHQRTELNSIRYAFTVLSSLSVYAVAFVFLYESEGDSLMSTALCLNGTNASVPCQNDTSTLSITNELPTEEFIGPDDYKAFRNMALVCICAGAFFSAVFHLGVQEPPFKTQKEKAAEKSKEEQTIQTMRKRDWFKQIPFYQVAALYMATRLYVNLYQVYIPLYVQDTLQLNKTSVATIPFAMYLAGFAGSLVMKHVNKFIGRKGTYAIGCAIGLTGCIWVYFGAGEYFEVWGIYIVAMLLGVGGSTVLITSLSITADLIGSNIEGGAFVYGFMSFVDKIANGVIIVLIQDGYTDSNYYRSVIAFACGSACVLGILVTISLIPVKVATRKGLSASIATLVESVDDEDVKKQKCEKQPISTISNIDIEKQFTHF